MTQGIAGGPYGDPSRFDPGDTSGLYPAGETITSDESISGHYERATSIYRCSYHFISQSRAAVHDLLGLVYYGQYAPHAAQYLPIYVAADRLPESVRIGSLQKATLDSNYWVHAIIGNWADRFHVHTIGMIRKVQAHLDTQFLLERPDMERVAAEYLAAGDEKKAVHFITDFVQQCAATSLETYTTFMFQLFAMVKDGQRITDLHAETVKPRKLFYPKWWLIRVELIVRSLRLLLLS
jgi:dipeptidase